MAHFRDEYNKDIIFNLHLGVDYNQVRLQIMPKYYGMIRDCFAIISILCKETGAQYKGYQIWNRDRDFDDVWNIHPVSSMFAPAPDSLTFDCFIDVIKWYDDKAISITNQIFHKSPLQQIEYEWKIDPNRLNLFLQTSTYTYFNFMKKNKFMYSNVFRGYNHDIGEYGIVFYWLRITNPCGTSGRYKIHLCYWSPFKKRQAGLSKPFKYAVCLEFLNDKVEYQGYIAKAKGDYKLYPSNNCQYRHILEKNITCLKSVKVLILRE